jgi:hypothetical protein
MDEHEKRLVAEIIKRLSQQLGADGTKGEIVVAFSGATVGMSVAMAQVRELIYDGYQVLTAFSENAKALFGSWVEDQLLGLPYIRSVAPSNWHSAFTGARAVVVPLLSLNTAAKVSQLIADTLPTNLMLHALAGGKPLIAAKNGVYPDDRLLTERAAAVPAFQKAVQDRLKTLEGFGCQFTDVKNLRIEVNKALREPKPQAVDSVQSFSKIPEHETFITLGQRLITAAHIRQAGDRGVSLRLAAGTVVTPLAKELAMNTGVKLIYSK